MSQQTSTSSDPSHPDNDGDASLNEPPIKRKKVDQCAPQEVPIPKMKIDDLPDECLRKILSFLKISELTNVAPKVCNKWQRVSLDPLLWQNKVLSIGLFHSDLEVMEVLSRSPQLQNVVMGRTVEKHMIHALAEKCRNLTTLKIAPKQEISYSLLEKLVNNCKNIQRLTIPNTLLGDENNAKLLAQLHHLHAMHITYCSAYNDAVHLWPFAKGCPNFAELKVSSEIRVETTDLLYFIQVRQKTLTHLVMPWTWYSKRCIFQKLKKCTLLTHLELDDTNGSRVLDDEEIGAFTTLGHLSTIRSLIVKSYWLCSVRGVVRAVKSGGLSQLQVLEIYDCKMEDNFMEAICTTCGELQKLCLKYCTNLSDDSLRQLYRLQKLEMIDFSSSKGLGGAAMSYVSQVPKLKKLFLERWDLRQLEPSLECILDISSLEVLSFCFTRFSCNFPFDRMPGKLVNLRLLKVTSCELDSIILDQLKEQMPSLQIDDSKDIFEDLFNYVERISKIFGE